MAGMDSKLRKPGRHNFARGRLHPETCALILAFALLFPLIPGTTAKGESPETAQTQTLKRDETAPDGRDKAETADSEAEQSATRHTGDPLLPYLAKWMTRNDYQLLFPVTEAGTGGQSSAALTRGSIGTYDKRSNANEKKLGNLSGMGAKPRSDNPYLQALEPFVMPAPSAPKADSSILLMDKDKKTSKSISPNPGETKQTPGEQIKERLKQNDDKKYFPQLKRF